MSIPRAALQGDVLSRTVYVKDYDLPHAFVKVPVQVGAMNDRFVEITTGLIAGDEVVTTGAYSLAFAGKGSVSLKEALDAAHGHEHNEDGSEVSSAQKSARRGGDDHEPGESGHKLSALTLFSLVANALLLLLLVAAMSRKPKTEEPTGQTPKVVAK